MDMLLDILTGICLVAGSVLMIIGAVGMIRMPDMFSRMHAAGIIDTLATFLILLGLGFQSGFSLISFKLFLILVLVMYTSPTATHALARAALDGGLKPRVAPDDDNAKEPKT